MWVRWKFWGNVSTNILLKMVFYVPTSTKHILKDRRTFLLYFVLLPMKRRQAHKKTVNLLYSYSYWEIKYQEWEISPLLKINVNEIFSPTFLCCMLMADCLVFSTRKISSWRRHFVFVVMATVATMLYSRVFQYSSCSTFRWRPSGTACWAPRPAPTSSTALLQARPR